MPHWFEVAGPGVRLACLDFGGDGMPLLVMHGLAGHSGEWRQFAAALGGRFRVIGLDQRGHGRSERQPADLSRAAFVADVAAVIRHLGAGPVALIGQSMGGNSAYLTAASHPELVTALIVVEASPYGPVPGLPDHIRRWLDSWPTPFADQEAAREFFASQGFAPEAWAEGLELRPDGLWPAFNRDTLIACMDDLAARDYWREWRSIRCPTLLVRGERGNFEDDHFAELARLLPAASCVTIRGAGHDVHLDAPRELAEEVGAWLAPTGGEPHGDHPKLA